MTLRCRNIPELNGLESLILRGGFSGADNEVRWPYLAENRSFRPWVKGGELVFVTGISRHRSPENLAECLYEGRECEIAGLVVLTGDAYIGQLPATLSRLADELAMPLFEQPYSLPMVQVTETISRAIVLAERTSSLKVDSLAAALVELIGPDVLNTLMHRYAPVAGIRHAESTELLEAWLAHQGNQCAMANSLGCHRNTIRNRMNRLAEDISEESESTQHFKTRLLAHLLTE